jgi:coniferyl-aldehyde dehydrogenase
MDETSEKAMQALLSSQREAFISSRPEPLMVRRDRLNRLIALLVDHGEALSVAMSDDFGHRSKTQGMMGDVLPAVSLAKYCRKNLRRWARPERRSSMFPLGLLGARAEVRHEPKGIIGIVAPWNFPIGLTLTPLAQVLAAGNRAMIKPSEYTPKTGTLLRQLIAQYFSEEEVTVCLGGMKTGQAFCKLPFDHLVFTGATRVGRAVLRAAADNLVPVTLELGGKSPVIVSRKVKLEQAAERIAIGKMLNAGQICLAPDYLLVPEEMQGPAVSAIGDAVKRMYPTLLSNDDYSCIISDRHRERLTALVDDAVTRGAGVVEVNPAGEDFSSVNLRKLSLTILTGVDESMAVMQEEIFGPVLPVMTYGRVDEAIDYVNAHDHPLGLYYFGEDTAEREHVLGRTLSGGVGVNDVVLHASMDDLPFGGIGASGMGSYHGPEGFRTFSHARAVFRQTPLDFARLAGLKPPYGPALRRLLKMQIRE